MKQITTISSMSPFKGKTIVLELGREINFRNKQELINYLREEQAKISYILTASTDYVLSTTNVDSYKIRRAKQLGIPIVNIQYVYEYRDLSRDQTSIDIDKFIIKSVEDQENFTKTGTISITGTRTNITKINKFDWTKIKLWHSDDMNLPHFDELTYGEIAKWVIFKETNDNSIVYFVLELQVIPEQYFDRSTSDYRLRFRYERQSIIGEEGQQQHGSKTSIQYAFSDDSNEQQQLFASYYNRIATMPRVTRIREMLPDQLGSKLLLRSLFTHRIDTQILDENVCQLIESIWLESIGDLNKILSILPESVTLKTIIEAEAALLEIKSSNDTTAVDRFYSLLPHRSEYKIDLIKNRRVLIEKLDLCQMLRDMVTVNELTNWNIKAPIEAKYRALKCHIETLDSSTPEFKNVTNLVQSSTDNNEQIVIHNIFSVVKQTDALNFCTDLSHQRQLFHGSKYANFLGILSRGLTLPKMVSEELGVVRTDIGCLGYGIYFSDSASTSLKYTTSSTTRPGRRLLCICQVALGESANYYSFAPNLLKPPNGFHSTHGVKRTADNHSMFTDNEYAIYQLNQQRLVYIVEVSCAPHNMLNIEFERLPIVHHQQQHTSNLNEDVEVPMTIDDEVIEIAEQDYGLICPSSNKLIPLKSFHIRAQIVDTTVEVVLYQVYYNMSSTPIEAKYVFPLDENSTVCAFEAHINNKIVKGVVKEKEQAKREYREAIEKGHGAYLMNQEQPQIFSVAVGNLPAQTEVIIKITYVAELDIENGDIIFRLPSKMTSWQSKQAIENEYQSFLRSIGMIDEKVEFSFKASLQMPYRITKLFSPTHRLRRKITDCIAMIELIDNVLIDRDFILSITLNSANLPRILNEINGDSQACMLTFYPRFEISMNSNEPIEIIFIIDVSNSMDGNYVQQAKQLTHLFLSNLTFDDENTYFNVITFGSDNDECFPISMPTTKENLDKAKYFVLHSLVHRGNTNLYSVLHRYSLLPSSLSSTFGRQFIILSDGHIHDLHSILILLENRSTMRHDRLFTCSIGNVADKHALKQLTNGAKGGGLTTGFDSNYRSKWKTKVLNILEHVRQPCVTSMSIEWHGQVDEEQKFHMQAPKIIRSLFDGMRLNVYRFINNCHKATLTATIDGQEFVTTVFSSAMTTTNGRILHCLTARAIIDDYENGLLHVDESENELIKAQYKQDLIDLSIKHSVVSPYTSFVAIEERDEKKDQQTIPTNVRLRDVMLDYDIDLLPYMGWEGDVSSLSSTKQKLIDARITLESASIQTKAQSIDDIEKLCETISYRTGGDAKFDLMMTIIRTYRYSLNDYEKADELEEQMRYNIQMEMISATTEERQELEQRCAMNNLTITDNENDEVNGMRELFQFLGDDFKQLSPIEQMQKIRHLYASLGEAPNFDDDLFVAPSSSSAIAGKKLSTPVDDDAPEMHASQRTEVEEEHDELDLGFLDCMDESSYKAFTQILSEMQAMANDLPPEILQIYEKTGSSHDETRHNKLTSKMVREAKQRFILGVEQKPEEDQKTLSTLPPESPRKLDQQEPKPLNNAPRSKHNHLKLTLPSPYYCADESTPTTTEVVTPFDPYANTVSDVKMVSFSSTQRRSSKISSPTISLTKPSKSNASSSGSSCMSCSIKPERDRAITTHSKIYQSSVQHGRISQSLTLNDNVPSDIVPGGSPPSSTNQGEKSFDCDLLDLTVKHEELIITDRAKETKRKFGRISTNDISTPATFSGDLLLLDVCPLSLGIEDIHGHMHTLIRRNTTIPTRTQLFPIFTNAYAYQRTATIRIFEGEHYLTKYNNFLGEFSLCGLTSTFIAQKLIIGVRMNIDANGILHVEAEELNSSTKASYTVTNDKGRLTKEDIERHITFAYSDHKFLATSVYDRKPDDSLYLLDGQVHNMICHFSIASVTSYDRPTDVPLLGKLKDIKSTKSMVEQVIQLQSEDGSFLLNKDLADVFCISIDTFNALENYLREQGFYSLALNIQNELLRLIGTGVILLWLFIQTQPVQQNMFQNAFDVEKVKVHLYKYLPANSSEQINKAVEFYQRTNQRYSIYCKHLELNDSSWNMFIQRILIGYDRLNN